MGAKVQKIIGNILLFIKKIKPHENAALFVISQSFTQVSHIDFGVGIGCSKG